MTSADLMLAILSVNDPTLPARVWATVAWVRRSCEAERLPDWCVALVVANVEREAVLGTFPLLPADAPA